MADRMLGRLVHHVLRARLNLTVPMLEPDGGSALVPVDLEPARMVVDRVHILTQQPLILKEPANHDVLVLVAHVVVDLLGNRAGVRGHQVAVLVGGGFSRALHGGAPADVHDAAGADSRIDLGVILLHSLLL